jgi:hypothetical protein
MVAVVMAVSGSDGVSDGGRSHNSSFLKMPIITQHFSIVVPVLANNLLDCWRR